MGGCSEPGQALPPGTPPGLHPHVLADVVLRMGLRPPESTPRCRSPGAGARCRRGRAGCGGQGPWLRSTRLSAAATRHGIIPGQLYPAGPSRREEEDAEPTARTEPRGLLGHRLCTRVSVSPRAHPTQRRHPHGPSARATVRDTVTLRRVPLRSFTLLEKEVLAAVVKSQQLELEPGRFVPAATESRGVKGPLASLVPVW